MCKDRLEKTVHALETIQDYGVSCSNKKARNGRVVKVEKTLTNEQIAMALINAGLIKED